MAPTLTFPWSSIGWTPGSWSSVRASLSLWRAFNFFGIGVVVSTVVVVAAVAAVVVVVVVVDVAVGLKRLSFWPRIKSGNVIFHSC